MRISKGSVPRGDHEATEEVEKGRRGAMREPQARTHPTEALAASLSPAGHTGPLSVTGGGCSFGH
jgi:hypothetical protein